MKQVALIANFSGRKFVERYGISDTAFFVSNGTLFYPDALPDPGAIILETNDPQGQVEKPAPKYKQTTDATPTNILTKTIPTNSSVIATCKVLAYSGTSVNAYLLVACLKRAGGNASLVGSSKPFIAENVSAWDVNAVASGTDGAIQVTGAAGTTVNWIVQDIEITVFTP